MKNIVWVILGILVLAVILFVMKKDDSQRGEAGPQMSNQNEGEVPVKMDKVFIDETGQELKVESTLKSAKLSFSAIGNVTLSGNPTASGVEYKSADGELVFWDRGTSGTLSQNGTVIFQGSLQENSSN